MNMRFAAVLLAAVCTAQASTVEFYLTNFNVSALNNIITLIPQGPVTSGNTVISGLPIRIQPTNSFASTNLLTGRYQFLLQGITFPQALYLVVPNDSATYSAASLITNNLTTAGPLKWNFATTNSPSTLTNIITSIAGASGGSDKMATNNGTAWGATFYNPTFADEVGSATINELTVSGSLIFSTTNADTILFGNGNDPWLYWSGSLLTWLVPMTFTNAAGSAVAFMSDIGNAGYATNFVGQLSPTNYNSGVNADATTWLRGDGTWVAPAGAGDVVAAGQNNFSGSNYFSGAVVINSTNPTTTVINLEASGYISGTLGASNIVGIIPIANLATGTPDGTKFIRDDGTLVTPSGSGDVTAAGDNVFTGSNTFSGGFSITGTNPTTSVQNLDIAGTLTGAGTNTLFQGGTNAAKSYADATYLALAATNDLSTGITNLSWLAIAPKADTNWVLQQVASLGAYLYFGGATNSFAITNSTESVARTNVWTGSSGPFVAAGTNTINSLVASAYAWHVISTNTYAVIESGPYDIKSYLYRTGGAGTVSGHWEIYAVDSVSNIMYELASSATFTVGATAPTLYDTALTLTNHFVATNNAYIAISFKVDSAGTGGPTLSRVYGGIYGAHLNFVRPLSSATINASQIVGPLPYLAQAETNGFAAGITNAAFSAATATFHPTNTQLYVLSQIVDGIVKGVPASGYTAASAGTDYATPAALATYAPTGSITSSSLTMATGKLLGRSTAGSGAVEEVTVGSGLSLSGGSLTATGGGGSATNAVSTIQTNSVDLGTAITNLNFVAGANTTVTGAVSSGTATIGISSSAGGGGNSTYGTTTFCQFDEMLAPITATYSSAPSGLYAYANNGTLVQLSGEPASPGIWRLATSTSASASPTIVSSKDAYNFEFGGGVVTNEWRVRFNDLPDETERYCAELGWGKLQGAGVPPDALMWRVSNTNGNYFEAVARLNDTESVGVTTVAVAAQTWYKLRIVLNAEMNNADFYVDGVLATNLTSSIPDAADDVTPSARIVKTGGTTSRAMDLDFFYIGYTLTNPR